jgi:hypothetical protein
VTSAPGPTRSRGGRHWRHLPGRSDSVRLGVGLSPTRRPLRLPAPAVSAGDGRSWLKLSCLHTLTQWLSAPPESSRQENPSLTSESEAAGPRAGHESACNRKLEPQLGGSAASESVRRAAFRVRVTSSVTGVLESRVAAAASLSGPAGSLRAWPGPGGPGGTDVTDPASASTRRQVGCPAAALATDHRPQPRHCDHVGGCRRPLSRLMPQP